MVGLIISVFRALYVYVLSLDWNGRVHCLSVFLFQIWIYNLWQRVPCSVFLIVIDVYISIIDIHNIAKKTDILTLFRSGVSALDMVNEYSSVI